MAESFSGLQPLQGAATANRTSGLSDDAAGLLDVVSSRQFPSRMAGWAAALKALTERAEGSPAALEGLLSPQLQDMARRLIKTNANISRTFGPYGGKQTPAAMGDAVAGLDLPGLYSNAAIQAGQQRQNFLSGTSIMAPQGSTFMEERQRPVDLAQIAQTYAGILGTAAQGYGAARGMFPQAPTSGTLPTTMAAYNAGNYAGTTYAPFGQAPAFPSMTGAPGGGTFGNAGTYPYMYQ